MLGDTDVVEKVGMQETIAWVIVVEMQEFHAVRVFVISILRVLAVCLRRAVN